MDSNQQKDVFAKAKCLSNFEALSYFQNLSEDSAPILQYGNQDNRKILFEKAKQYAEQFSQFTNDSQLRAARDSIRAKLIKNTDVEKGILPEVEHEKKTREIEHDTVMMLNLCPKTVQEAKSFIPSLNNRTDDEIRDMIAQLERFRC